MMTEGEPEIDNGETNLVLRQIVTNHDCSSATLISHSFSIQTEFFNSKGIFLQQ